MARTRFLNKFGKDGSNENSRTYKKQRSSCVKIVKTAKEILYNNLDVKKITYDDKLFWKTVKLKVTDKTLKDEIITSVED